MSETPNVGAAQFHIEQEFHPIVFVLHPHEAYKAFCHWNNTMSCFFNNVNDENQ
jgi:hypothetical protein